MLRLLPLEIPVKKDIVRIAPFSLLIALITCSHSAVSAQSNVGLNTVIEVREDRARSSAAIITSSKRPLPRPIIQFLQGENGTTVLVADFNDVVFPGATKVIHVGATPVLPGATTGSAGIKLVRVGRFQESPPICRVAIVSGDREKLKAVTFDSRPGSLLVRWPKSAPHATGTMPPPAPSLASVPARRRAYQTNFVPPAVAPPTGVMDPNSMAIPQVSQPYQATIDPAIASNYGGLRPPLPEPGAYHDQIQRPQASRPAGAEKPAQELIAKTHSLPAPKPPAQKAAEVAAQPEQSRKATMYGAAPARETEAPKPPTLVSRPINTESARKNEPAKQAPVGSAPGRLPPGTPAIVGSTPADTGSVQPKEKVESNPKRGGLVSNLFAKVKHKAKALLASEGENPANQDRQESARAKTETINIDAVPKKEQASGGAAGIPADPSKSGADSQTAHAASEQPELPPSVMLIQNSSGSYTIKIVSPDKSDLNFSSFRMHNPERFVVDFMGLRSIQALEVPQPDKTEMLKSIRVGAPDPLKNTGRLVLDLAGEAVSVIPGDVAGNNEVAFVVGQAVNPLVGLTAPPGSTIVIDAGHGGSDPGAQRGYVKEKDLTLAIAKKLRDKLENNGVKCVMTRGDDTFIALADRVSVTNNLKPDAFLSVHINSLESTSDIHGIETYYQTDMSKALAQSIHDSLVGELNAPDRAIRRAKFYVVNRAEVPAVLAEVGFISNKAERDKLVSEDYQEKIAGALAKGAILYLKQQSAVAGKISRASEQPPESLPHKGAGSTIPRASELAHKGLGIKNREQ